MSTGHSITLLCTQCSQPFHAFPMRVRKYKKHFCGNECRVLYQTDLPARFWERVEIGSFRVCWPWQGCIQNNGYGQIRSQGKCLLSHRVAFRLMWHTLPDDILALHRCDNPCCCNPWHLFAGSHQDNATDMINKSRQSHAVTLSGASHPWAKYSDADVRDMRQSFATEKETIRQLAERYNGTYQGIWYIIKGRNRKDA